VRFYIFEQTEIIIKVSLNRTKKSRNGTVWAHLLFFTFALARAQKKSVRARRKKSAKSYIQATLESRFQSTYVQSYSAGG
jgi:hypothetical protein